MGNNIKISKTHGLLNKMLFSLYTSLCLGTATCASCRLPQRQSFFHLLNTVLHRFQTSQVFIRAIYSFVFWFENDFLQIYSQLYITACIKNCVYNNFNLCCYFKSSTIERLYKSFSFVNSSVQISSLNQKFLEVL